MHVNARRLEVAYQGGSPMVSDDGAVGSHAAVRMSTNCADFKHKMSFDPALRHWQLRRMAIGKRIEAARKGKRWSQQKLADEVGKQQTTISSWERGRTEPTREDVQRVADALQLTAAELELEDAAPASARTVPLKGYVGAGSMAHYYASADEGLDEVEAPENATENTVAAEIRGASLGPAFDRWLVFYDDVRSPVTPDLFGQLCVVGLTTDQVLVKILRPAGTPGRFHLISNGGEEPIFDKEVLWAARVTTMKPR